MLAKQDRNESSQPLSSSMILKTSQQKTLSENGMLGLRSRSRSGNRSRPQHLQRRLSSNTEQPVAFADAARGHLLAEKNSGNTSGASNG